MHLRAESFTPDAEAIAERLRVVLAKLRQRGIPKWAAGLGLTTAFAAGVAIGPMTLNQLGLPFPGVTLPGDERLRDDLARAEDAARVAKAAQQAVSQRTAAIEKERDSLKERLATTQKERDEALKDLVTANTRLSILVRRPEPTPTSRRIFRDCSDCPEMVEVPAGRFSMGSADGASDEKPVHEVAIQRSLAVGKFEVTFAEWEACVADCGCASNKSPDDRGWGKGRQPVINVSWTDAKEYVAWLSSKTRQSYRLLTEAEWEYAARASSSTAYPWGTDIGRSNANCDGCGSSWDNKRSAPVGSFAANAFGLHDMNGNVWEWVEDCYQGNYDGAPSDGSARSLSACSLRVLRGGSWGDHPRLLRSAGRGRYLPDYRDVVSGFRVARTF